MRLVLVNPPVLQERLYGPLAPAAPVLPPMGLASLAAYAGNRGIEPTIVDAVAEGLDVHGTAAAVLRMAPDAVGLSATTMAITRAAAVACKLHVAAPGLPVMVGGAHPTALPERTLAEFPDFTAAVFGEGEETLVEACHRLDAREGLAGVAGLAWRDGDRVATNEPRPLIKDLDTLPHPAWRLLPDLARRYRPSVFGFRHLPSTYVVASRGCPGRCTFCAYQYWGRRYRAHGPAWVVALLRDLRDGAGIRDVAFSDGVFGVSRRHVAAMCEAMLDASLDLSWSCNLRIEMRDPALLRLMRRAGCWSVAYGIESGSQQVLDVIGKHITPAEVAEAVRNARAAGIVTKGYIMVGSPSETAATLAETERFVLGLDLDLLTVNHFVPYPGTEDWSRADRFGTLDRSWDRCSEHLGAFVPHGLTRNDLVAARRRLVRRFYLRPRTVARAAAIAREIGGLSMLLRGGTGLARLLLERY